MCNPRRITVQAKRKISEAFRAEIKRAFTARGDVSSEARLEQQIDDLLPKPARIAFESAMRDDPQWVWSAGSYRRTVPGGAVTYRPDSGELEIVIELRQAIEAVGEATLEHTGEVSDEVTADAVGVYYDDGWRGHTKDRAESAARAEAEKNLDELAERRRAALLGRAEESARLALHAKSGEAEAQARRTAEQQLTAQAEQARDVLDGEATRQLEVVQSEVLQGILQTVAAGYSRALQAYAAEHGENLRVSEDNGVIEIQFEMER